MKSIIRGIAICGIVALPAGLAAHPAPTTPDAAAPVTGASATAEVFHSLTREPLADMPVFVVRVIPPDGGTGSTQVFKTGRDGRALLVPLEAGAYECYVEFNNNQSNVERFEIDPYNDFHPVVTLLFNPDIDDPRN